MPDVYSEEEIDQIIDLRKWIEQDIEWIQEEGYFRFRVPVLCEEDYALRLIGVLTEKTGYYRYNLLLGEQPARMLHVGKAHHNPDCAMVGRRHKHKWTDAYGQDWGYEPKDIDASDLQRAFETFLQECRIECRGRFVRPRAQMKLPW